jgi:hypothetical protein
MHLMIIISARPHNNPALKLAEALWQWNVTNLALALQAEVMFTGLSITSDSPSGDKYVGHCAHKLIWFLVSCAADIPHLMI